MFCANRLTTAEGNITTNTTDIAEINETLEDIPDTYVNKTQYAEDLENLKPIRTSIRLNNLTSDTTITGYNYKKTVTVQGVTSDFWGYGQVEYGTYQLPFIIETGTNSVTLYLAVAPATTTRILVVLTNTKEVT